jgi:hypothetical protein
VRALTATCALIAALLLPASALASAVQTPGTARDAGVGLPFAPVQSVSVAPPGFTSTATQAIAAAKATATMQALHRRLHPLQIEPFVWRGTSWAVDFSYRGQIVAEADLTPSGRVTHVYTGPQAAAGYTRGHYAGLFDSWWVVVPFSLLFLVPFVDPRRLWRLRHLDALVLLSFLFSYWLFNRGHVESAVWLAYPPLIYLAVRMVSVGVRGRRRSSAFGALLSPKMLLVGLLLLMAARITLSLVDHEVIDVGFASVIGAHRITHGQPLYYAALAHPDTYGPIAYLAYVPFELVFPWHGAWDYLASAHAASIAFDLVTVVGLVVLGRRLRPGIEGRRLGLALGWAWAACPFTLLGLMEHSNDGLVAMLSVLCLLVFASPIARGAMLGLATAAKFSPGALLPLFAGHRDRGLKGAAACIGAFALVVAVAIGAWLPSGGITEFWNHTIGFQLHRVDVFSAWALHPGLTPVKTVLELAVGLFVVGIAFTRRQRSLVEVCALAAAVTIAVQLPAVHWFYYYIIWFIPFVLVALLADTPAAAPPHHTAGGQAAAHSEPAPEPVMVGV